MNPLETKICEEIRAFIDVKQSMMDDPAMIETILQAAACMADALKQGGKILICGNGGSSGDALHIAGELIRRFQRERCAYAAIALNTDPAVMTSIANDYNFEQIFVRRSKD